MYSYIYIYIAPQAVPVNCSSKESFEFARIPANCFNGWSFQKRAIRENPNWPHSSNSAIYPFSWTDLVVGRLLRISTSWKLEGSISRMGSSKLSRGARFSPSSLTFCSELQCVAVCCSVLQCVAVCCSVLQCVAVCCSVLYWVDHLAGSGVLQVVWRFAVCGSVLQCVAVYYSVLLCCSMLQYVSVCCSVL